MVYLDLSSKLWDGGEGVDVGRKEEKILDFVSSTKSDPGSCLAGGSVKDSGTAFRHSQKNAIVD